MRRAGRVLLVLAAVLVVLMGALWALQRKLIYQPDTARPPAAASVIPGAQDIELTTSDGLELEAWLLPPPGGTDRELAVLFAPGNGGNRAGRSGLGALIAQRGFTVLLLDYRGYGGNPGSPSEEGVALDARAGVKALRDRGFTPQQMIYVGESLGTGVVAELQTEIPPAGVVLRSPFTAFADVASEHFPWVPVRMLLRDEYPVSQNLAKTDVPVTVIYGDRDTIVPTALSKQVAADAPNLVEELEVRGNHNDSVMYGPQVADAVARLADEVAP